MFGEKYSHLEQNPHAVIKSPRDSLLPNLSADEASRLAYPPYAMPGQRDVVTPYGTMRVNEWGPIGGPKVLFVHGDTTPSLIWSKIAYGLAKKGCRVMTFDLWGRGYTDAPQNVRYDARFYSSQAYFAISSSKLDWTTKGAFSMVGFSKGGAITTDFASTYPQLLKSVVLIAPGGLLRSVPAGYDYFMQQPDDAAKSDHARKLVAGMIGIELEHSDKLDEASSKPLEGGDKVLSPVDEDIWMPIDLSMADLVQWQWKYHAGIVHAITNSAKYGPIMHHYAAWRRLREIYLKDSSDDTLLKGSRMLVILGEEDTVVDPQDVREGILSYMPADQIEFSYLPGDHGFVYPHSEELVSRLAQFWDLDRTG